MAKSLAEIAKNGHSSTIDRRSALAFVPIALLLGAAATTLFAYWPGLMTWDSVRQYGQALDGRFDDWHPPAMEWAWQRLLPLSHGPAPMLVLQSALYWGGFAALVIWAAARRRLGLGAALTGVALLPISIALTGEVLKDGLMAGLLLVAAALLAWRDFNGARVRTLLGVLVAVMVFTAATLRFNAVLACLPLLVAALPRALVAGKLRLISTTAVTASALLLALPAANHLLDAESSGVELSLVIFDLGGITERSGVDVFPPMGVADAVTTNHQCYSPVKWDPYSFWVDPVCPLGFGPFRAAIGTTAVNPYLLWMRAVVGHPIAYVQHRLAHFNIATRFLVTGEVERAVQVESAPNVWGYVVTPNRLLTLIDDAAVASAKTPFGWPIVWIALAAGVIAASSGLPSRRVILPLAISGLLYGVGYGVLGVASELRYHLWTIIAAGLAAAIALDDCLGRRVPEWRRIVVALGPALVVSLVAIAWRSS